jgi:hypothetical protein
VLPVLRASCWYVGHWALDVQVVGPVPFIAHGGRLVASEERHHHLLTSNALVLSRTARQRLGVNGLWLDEVWESGREFPLYEGDEVRVAGEAADVTVRVRRA